MTEPIVMQATMVRIDGGVPITVDLAARAVRSWGWTSIVVGPAEGRLRERIGNDLPYVAHHGGRISQQLPAAILSLRAAVAQHRPDILHLHSSWAGLAGRILPRRRQRPIVVFQPHAWSFSALDGPSTRVARIIERGLARRCELTICCSNDEAETGRLARISSRFEVVDNGVDTIRYSPVSPDERARLKAAHGLPPEAPVVVSVGRIAEQKRYDLALAAWREVVKARPDAHLAIVGDGPLRSALEALGTPNVRWFGRTSTPEDFHRMADLSLLTSDYEGRSLSLLEAMACGSPIVSTVVDGVRDLVDDPSGTTGPGCLVPTGDSHAITAAVLAMLDRDLTGARTAARSSILARFTLDVWTSSMKSCYERLLGH